MTKQIATEPTTNVDVTGLIIRNQKHECEMEQNDIKPIDLVIMNLYPFQATVASGAGFEMCIENIDIGGPSMLRSSAKNHAYVTIVSSVGQYATLTGELEANNGFAHCKIAYCQRLIEVICRCD